MRRATIRDVAAEAGVSIGTASKALNGQGKLRAETRERVAEAAQRLGFAPNTLAQALLAGRSFTVGLITTDSFGRFSIPVMLGAEDALGTGQVSVFMCDTRDDPERERRYVETLAARRVDGLIVTGRRVEPRPPVVAGPGIPVVYAMTQPLSQDGPAVLPDDGGGGRAAAEHLLGVGRRRIGHVTGPERFLAARERAAGFGGALAAAGLRPHGGARFGEWSEHWGREAVGQLLANCPDTDAIFCGSDQIARGVADTLRATGRTVPGDVALVGFDNWEPMALGAQPPLTSVDMCLEEVGRVAAELLLAAIAGEPAHGTRTVPSRLVVRQSSRG
jgi:LacI family transcriptional regulator